MTDSDCQDSDDEADEEHRDQPKMNPQTATIQVWLTNTPINH